MPVYVSDCGCRADDLAIRECSMLVTELGSCSCEIECCLSLTVLAAAAEQGELNCGRAAFGFL